MSAFVTVSHERCRVVRPGTYDGRPALLRRERDGFEFEAYYDQLGLRGTSAAACAFYGVTENSGVLNKRLHRINKRLRAELYARTVKEWRP